MQLKSFPTIVQELGHLNRTIDILKIDVEGAEFSVFLDKQVMALMATLVRQILIEVHYKSEAQTVALARAFSEAAASLPSQRSQTSRHVAARVRCIRCLTL